MAKYLATSLAMLKVVSEPRVMSSCLPISMTSSSLVGLSRGPSCCRPLWRPACRCSWPRRRRPGRGRGRRWCRRRSWPPCGRRPVPGGCSASLSSGFASARKSSTPASSAMAAAVNWLSPVTMTVRMPMLRSWAKRSLMPPLTMSLRRTTPSTSGPSVTTSGVPPEPEMLSTISARLWGTGRLHVHEDAHGLGGAFADAARGLAVPGAKSTPLIRVCAVKGTNCAWGAARSRPRRSNFSLASTAMLRPSGVSSASEASCAASARRSDRDEAARE